MRAKALVVCMAALPLLGACEGSIGYKQPAGVVLGGAAGGLLGSQVGSGSGRLAATAGGALLGALLGGEAGRSLDKADVAYGRQLVPHAQVPVAPPAAAPSMRPAPTYSGSPAPGDYRSVAGPRNCQALAAAPGQPTSYACQATDGSWFIAR